jgi:nitronate monooxygenase
MLIVHKGQTGEDAGMGLSTGFTRMFGVQHPIVLAPMGGSAGGRLAAAVSRGGGLGLLGSGDGDPAWLDRELPMLAGCGRPWGVGLLTWAVDVTAVRRVLARGARTVMLSFGDPAPFAGVIKAAGARLIVQVTDLDEASRALAAGADVLVAQGTEAGGHGARKGRSTLPFVPAVVDLAAGVPVLAAGGIADGRGVAAVLALGAAGAVLGTRFQATAEALVDPVIARAILAGRGDETERSRLLDVARGSAWPDRYSARTLGHPYLVSGSTDREQYARDVASGVIPPLPVWAGEGVDLIGGLAAAEDLVGELAVQAGAALARAGRRE